MKLSRRFFLGGLLATPAIVSAGSLMKVRAIVPPSSVFVPPLPEGWLLCDGAAVPASRFPLLAQLASPLGTILREEEGKKFRPPDMSRSFRKLTPDKDAVFSPAVPGAVVYIIKGDPMGSGAVPIGTILPYLVPEKKRPSPIEWEED